MPNEVSVSIMCMIGFNFERKLIWLSLIMILRLDTL